MSNRENIPPSISPPLSGEKELLTQDALALYKVYGKKLHLSTPPRALHSHHPRKPPAHLNSPPTPQVLTHNTLILEPGDLPLPISIQNFSKTEKDRQMDKAEKYVFIARGLVVVILFFVVFSWIIAYGPVGLFGSIPALLWSVAVSHLNTPFLYFCLTLLLLDIGLVFYLVFTADALSIATMLSMIIIFFDALSVGLTIKVLRCITPLDNSERKKVLNA